MGQDQLPEIFNTDQGSRFTSRAWIQTLANAGAKVSMDGKGLWMDNMCIKRLLHSVKHEGVYLWANENVHQLEAALEKWFNEYNHWKPHQALGYKTPWECTDPPAETTLDPWLGDPFPDYDTEPVVAFSAS